MTSITLNSVFTVMAIFGAVSSQATASRIIATGWDSPTPARFRAELAEFEKWGCFDGTTIAPTRKLADGRVVDCRRAFSREHWEWAEFAEAVNDLREAKPTIATNNFLFVYANPGDVDWFDDTGWREIVDHWRLVARLAREGGLCGVLYDAEPYTKPHSQFRYSAQPGAKNHTFADYCVKARERGQEVMNAVATEFPDITIMTYRLFCDLLPALDSGDVKAAIEPSVYSLQPAFVDGWCDVMPDTVRIVEGDEDAYLFNSEEKFYRAFTRLKLGAPAFVSPENREKLGKQYYVGHGIYLDAHVNPPTSRWHIDRLGGTSAQRLAANVASALKTSDGFIWIYGEKAKWWPGGNPDFPMWPEKLQGADEALRRARDPIGTVQEILDQAQPEDNVLRNGEFRQLTANGNPEDWWIWQDERSHGRTTADQEAACLIGVANGVFGQNITVKPGEGYGVRCRIRSVGRGFSCLSIGWKTPEGKWTAQDSRRYFAPIGDTDSNGWREALGLVLVPSGAGEMVFMLSIQGQITEDDRAWFDDCQAMKYEE
ncbi:hypothetical protein ACFL6S_32955 [Candidatus Poribacteria bacterium]